MALGVRVGDRIRVTRWAVSSASDFDENKGLNAPPIEGVVVGDGNLSMGQVADVRFDNGARLFVLVSDRWQVLE